MTLSELSLRNARRQARDYLVYFVTIIMAAALIYAFSGLAFSEEIETLAKMMEMLPVTIGFASIVVVCIIGWLVSYTTNFMLNRRSRELGTYILIGIENRQVAKLFFLENLAVGACAMAVGILLGNLMFQALRAILMAMFGIVYTFSFAFSIKSVAATLVCFGFIYLFAQLKSRRRIRTMKIYDLIYLDRQNEEAVFQTSRSRRRIFAVSIVFGVVGTCFLIIEGWLFAMLGAACVIVFLYGFFLSFASGVPAFFDRRPEKKYRGQTLLVFRTLTAKLATMGVVMATISLLFTATLIAEGSGQVFHSLFKNRAAWNSFDLLIGTEDEGGIDARYLDYIKKEIPVRGELEYAVYRGDNLQVTEYIENKTKYYRYYDCDGLMRYSDYCALRAMLGYPEVTLAQGQYLIHCKYYLGDIMEAYTQSVTVSKNTLAPGGVYTEMLAQDGWDVNGAGFILVVPDEAAENSAIRHHMYAAMTKQPVNEEQFAALETIRDEKNWEAGQYYNYDNLCAKSVEEKDVAVQTAIAVLPLYYLALALTMTAATILTIQQLAETERYRHQFALLGKLGTDERELAGALKKQLAIYYAMPAVPPILIGIPFIVNLGNSAEPGVMVGMSHPAVIAGTSLGLFFMIYAVYILLAYTSLRRSTLAG